jgi:hypothetical protein
MTTWQLLARCVKQLLATHELQLHRCVKQILARYVKQLLARYEYMAALGHARRI